jgi:SAM-dependent methyltransferase
VTTATDRRRQAPAAERDAAEDALHTIASRILAARHEAYDPWLYGYCGELANPDDVSRYLRYQLDHLALGGIDPRGASVLDAGCGFGLALVTCGLLGAAKLRGIDNHRGMVETVHAYESELPEDLANKLDVIYGDVSDTPYEDGEFDIVLSIEAISHYLDVDAFISEAARVLRPGGALIVSDGNNGANPLIRRKTRRIWDAFESGPSGSAVNGHVVGKSYVERREAILQDALPELDAAARRQLAVRTSGMVEEDVIAAGQTYVRSGALPQPARGPDDVPVSPEGQVMERLFDPYELAAQIERHGFSCRVYGYWGGAQGSPLLRSANALLARVSRLSIYTARSFRIAAVRT